MLNVITENIDYILNLEPHINDDNWQVLLSKISNDKSYIYILNKILISKSNLNHFAFFLILNLIPEDSVNRFLDLYVNKAKAVIAANKV